MTTAEHKPSTTIHDYGRAESHSPWPRVGYALVFVVVPLMLLALVLPPVRGKAADQKQDWVLGLAIGTAIASGVAYFVPSPLFPRRHGTLPLIVFGTAMLLIANILWNRSFLDYTRRPESPRNEVFRRAMRNFHAPVYGRYDNAIARSKDAAPPYSYRTLPWVMVASGVALGWFAWARRRPLERRWDAASFAILCGFTLAMIALFALCEPPRLPGQWAPQRFTLQLSGYSEFASDVPAFTGVRDTLATYVEKMPRLNWYGQHYPPGNLILLTIEKQLGVPGLTKAIVCLLTALTAVPLYLLAKELELDDIATTVTLLLFSITHGVLIYATLNTTSMVMFPGTMCLWLLVRALRRGDAAAMMLLGVFYTLYLFFSFSASILGVLMALTTLLGWWSGAFRLRNILLTGAVSLACLFATVFLLYLTTRFNLIACFITAVRGHQTQQGNEGFDSAMRWWLRSTGNIIAYALSIVPLSILAVAAVWRAWFAQPRTDAPQRDAALADETPADPHPAGPLDYARPATTRRWVALTPPGEERALTRALFTATVATVLVAGFSGLFYVETERIWIFLTPPFALAAGYELTRRAQREGPGLIYVVLFLVVAISCTQEFFFQHYR
jgi:hypothetical protein